MTRHIDQVLITGSRDWSNQAALATVLHTYAWRDGLYEATILHSGACPRGADQLAEHLWQQWGLPLRRWPADWNRYGRSAGPRRNHAMITHLLRARADGQWVLVIAFINPGSKGAGGCARAAHHAGLSVRLITPGRDRLIPPAGPFPDLP